MEGSDGFHSRYEAALARFNTLIALALRRMEGAYDQLDAPRIAYLAELFRVQSLEEDDEARFSSDERELFMASSAGLEARGLEEAINWRGDPTRRWADKTRETTEGFLHLCRDMRAVGDLDGMMAMWSDTAEELFEVAGLVIDPLANEPMRQLCRALNDAAISTYELKLQRLAGDAVSTPAQPVPPEAVKVAQENLKAPKEATRLLNIFDGYAAAQKLTPGVRSEWRRYIQRLINDLGHDDAKRITADHLLDWRDHLLSDPSRSGKLRDPVTVRDKYITSVRACLNWAVEERLLSSNPALNIKVRVPKKAKLRDRDFTLAEAKAILTATLEPPPARLAISNARARRWIPWLCAYSGARVNEMSQLRKEDVVEIEGIWAIRISPEAGTVKNKSVRVVPIHQHTVDQGFLEVVASLDDGPIFYDQHRQRVQGDDNRHFKKVGERLAQWVRKDVGIIDPGIKPNHAWRHTFKTMSYAVDIEERVVDAIQGHSPKTVGRAYGRAPLTALAAAIAKIPRFKVEGS